MDTKSYIKQNFKGILILTIIVVVAVLRILTFVDFRTLKSPKNPPQAKFSAPKKDFISILKKEDENQIPKGKPYVAQIFITGTIRQATEFYDQKWLLETIEFLEKDENNKALILFIDSPGGAVYEADEAFLRLCEYKTKTSRPIYAYFASMAASGGYYIGCAADYIMANRNSLTGSIGVISGQFLDISSLMEKYGIKFETIFSGRNKMMGSITQSLTDEQRQIMQSISDECYDQFTKIVSESRNLELEKVQELSDGRIFTAKQALEVNLIDSVGSLNDLVETLERKEFDFNSYEIVPLKYEYKPKFFDLISTKVQEFRKVEKNSVGIPIQLQKLFEPAVEFPAYYFEFANRF